MGITTADRSFAIKTALFNSVGFLLIIAAITYVDSHLTSHVVYGARHYRYGYWVSLVGALVIALSTLLIFRGRWSAKAKAVLPSVVLTVTSALSLPFFRPQFPHVGILVWMLPLSLVSLFSCLIRLVPPKTDWLRSSNATPEVKLERIKEYANLWRTVAVSISVGYIALIVPASNLIWTSSPGIVTKPSEAFLLVQFGIVAFAWLSLYVVFGVLYETFRRANLAGDLMFEIKEACNSTE